MFSKKKKAPERVLINGNGRIGRLALRTLLNQTEVTVVAINELRGDIETSAYITEYDTHHGRFLSGKISTEGDIIDFDGTKVKFLQIASPADVPIAELGVTVVMECTGKFCSVAKVQPFLDLGAKKVVVSAPVKDAGVPNVVLGVNEAAYVPAEHSVVTAASCTTNCIAPVIKLLHDKVGVKHGSITTIHCLTNTQSVLDAAWCAEKEPRRARGAINNFYPTTTGSAKAVTEVIPELRGKLNGHAVRVPMATASLTDITLEMAREVTAAEVNGLFAAAEKGELAGILGIEEKKLTAADYCNDGASTIIDAASTIVMGGTQCKVLAWYDNEWGYACRLAELTRKVAAAM
ncbi:glyceraldehyde-3-phosphate dehydrogenase [Emiliania huxleyi CCMP1516]|uniref:glyceraldehyde-3-phosphate dehydrogenase (NADP(+)) (phosphorylating) n=2 Tax=Emiliania huxleyi TaxID=2903 RepID=A0A0D3K4M9_EMIH1|nr:glyceraldehyde-3-phosphate dehydrogenase [Emiliania huxleyi CCMP1516]EOD30714.1 glyceraldehyde-3-phosphate dehydrogenase [Emiliania huxleyi CCMP1516]|eukprot:XP_005783143.1 glyceraldehyde-3-phosphate dehydrogenase [Emiliania huxleyi CCMP1516]